MNDKEKVLKAARKKNEQKQKLYMQRNKYKNRVYFLVDFMKAEDNGSVS